MLHLLFIHLPRVLIGKCMNFLLVSIFVRQIPHPQLLIRILHRFQLYSEFLCHLHQLLHRNFTSITASVPQSSWPNVGSFARMGENQHFSLCRNWCSKWLTTFRYRNCQSSQVDKRLTRKCFLQFLQYARRPILLVLPYCASLLFRTRKDKDKQMRTQQFHYLLHTSQRFKFQHG